MRSVESFNNINPQYLTLHKSEVQYRKGLLWFDFLMLGGVAVSYLTLEGVNLFASDFISNNQAAACAYYHLGSFIFFTGAFVCLLGAALYTMRATKQLARWNAHEEGTKKRTFFNAVLPNLLVVSAFFILGASFVQTGVRLEITAANTYKCLGGVSDNAHYFLMPGISLVATGVLLGLITFLIFRFSKTTWLKNDHKRRGLFGMMAALSIGVGVVLSIVGCPLYWMAALMIIGMAAPILAETSQKGEALQGKVKKPVVPALCGCFIIFGGIFTIAAVTHPSLSLSGLDTAATVAKIFNWVFAITAIMMFINVLISAYHLVPSCSSDRNDSCLATMLKTFKEHPKRYFALTVLILLLGVSAAFSFSTAVIGQSSTLYFLIGLSCMGGALLLKEFIQDLLPSLKHYYLNKDANNNSGRASHHRHVGIFLCSAAGTGLLVDAAAVLYTNCETITNASISTKLSMYIPLLVGFFFLVLGFSLKAYNLNNDQVLSHNQDNIELDLCNNNP